MISDQERKDVFYPIELTTLSPTWIPKTFLSLGWNERRDDWPFEVTLIPGSALTEAERKMVFKDFKSHMNRTPGDIWSEEWIFSYGYETFFAVRGKSKSFGTIVSKLTPKNLLGVVSFSRAAEWSHEIEFEDDDEKEPEVEQGVLNLHLEPHLVYVKPAHRGLKLGYLLMHALAEVFRADLELCVAARPVRVDCYYMGEYYSGAGERVGEYCVDRLESIIHQTRSWFGWLTPIGDLDVDGGM